MKTLQEKKQRKIIRLKDYDYSEAGGYFVTICTKSRKLFFKNNQIKQIAQKCWLEIPQHFSNIELEAFVIMPNHLHGIIIIENVGTDYNLSLQRQNRFQKVIPKSLSYIIAGYKSAVTRITNETLELSYFQWQPRFYEHVIRDEKSLNNIQQYIIDNPLQWELDAENPCNQNKVDIVDITKYYKNIITK